MFQSNKSVFLICVKVQYQLDGSPERRSSRLWLRNSRSFLLKLEHNFLTMLCWSLLYSNMNQLYVHIHPFPPSWASPSVSSLSTWLSSLRCAAASWWLSVLHMAEYLCHCSVLSLFLVSPPAPYVLPSCDVSLLSHRPESQGGSPGASGWGWKQCTLHRYEFY